MHVGHIISTHDHVIIRVDSKRLCTIVSTKKSNNVQLSDETMQLRVLFTLIFTFSRCQAASGEDFTDTGTHKFQV